MTATIKAFERPVLVPESHPAPAPVPAPQPAARAPVPSGATPAGDPLHLHHLPPAVAARFTEALGCYSHGLWQACAVMCRMTVDAILADVGSTGRMRIFNLVAEVEDAAGLDEASFRVVRAILFEGAPVAGDFDRWHAAVLVETLKDLVTQQYVRPARLRQAFAVRRYFATEAGSPPARKA